VHDPANLRSHVDLAHASQVPAQASAARLRDQDLQQQIQASGQEPRQQRAIQY
jgi:hypothetical protein